MINMKKLILGGLILVLMSGMAAADEVFAPDPALAAYGTRPLGMGGAFVALADDTNAIFTNPAGLAGLGEWSLTSMSTQLLQKVDYKLIGGTYRLEKGSVGLGYIGTSAPCGYVADDGGILTDEQISFDSAQMYLSYGVNLSDIMYTEEDMGNVSVGTSLKFLSRGFTGIDGATASGMNLDIGCKIELEDSPFSLGAAMKNLGGALNWESGDTENIEGATKFGTAANVLEINDLKKTIPGELIAAFDIELLSGGKPMVFHLGAEYKPIQYLAVRLGLDQDPVSKSESSTNLTAGVGVEYEGFSFDYAFRQNADLQDYSNHSFSISYTPPLPGRYEKAKEDKDEKESTEVAGADEEEKPEEWTTKNKSDKKKKKSPASDMYELPEEYRNIFSY